MGKFLVFLLLWADIDESKLIDGTEVINSTFTHNKTGCQMTFDDDYSAYWVYFINFLGTLAVLPGNIVSALLMDKIGRLSMLGRKVRPGSLVTLWVCQLLLFFWKCVCPQVAPWSYQASAVFSCGSAPVNPWWFSCCAFIMASASLPGTPWMLSPPSPSLLSGGNRTNVFFFL